MTDDSKKKFIVIAFAGGMSLGLLFTTVSFLFRSRVDSKESVVYTASAQAKIISSNVQCSLSFDDREDANNILDTLKTQNYIAFAGIYDADNRLFAYYYRYDIKQSGFKPSPPTKAQIRTISDFLVINEPVIVEKKRVGTVSIWVKL